MLDAAQQAAFLAVGVRSASHDGDVNAKTDLDSNNRDATIHEGACGCWGV